MEPISSMEKERLDYSRASPSQKTFCHPFEDDLFVEPITALPSALPPIFDFVSEGTLLILDEIQ